ncbi:D-glycerate dehydrogenase [Alcaligenaceae bacterium CGII-47]|nr:D-glycerate dehydrogenase [Alcaligenaceae bacterium CGII-47]
MGRKRVLVYRALPARQLMRIKQVHDVVCADPRIDGQMQAFQDALGSVHGMIGSSYVIDEALLLRAPHLEVVSSISVGVDKYQLDALHRRGIVLCHTPGVLTEAVADLLFAMVLTTSRRVLELAGYVRAGHWIKNISEDLYGWNVYGKTLGILGYGRIGQALARRAALGFDMSVLYHTRGGAPRVPLIKSPESDAPPDAMAGKAQAVELVVLLAQSDFVVVVLPLTAQTRGMIGEHAFSIMKRGAILINGARGPIVDEAALIGALDSGQLRAAGLDVFDIEPLPGDSPLRTHPKVLALPHIGSATHETREAMAEMATSNLLLALAGQAPLAIYPTAPAR